MTSAFSNKKIEKLYQLCAMPKVSMIFSTGLQSGKIKIKLIYLKMSSQGGGVLQFVVIRGCADFQGQLFDPKYFRQGANLSFNKVLG